MSGDRGHGGRKVSRGKGRSDGVPLAKKKVQLQVEITRVNELMRNGFGFGSEEVTLADKVCRGRCGTWRVGEDWEWHSGVADHHVGGSVSGEMTAIHGDIQRRFQLLRPERGCR